MGVDLPDAQHIEDAHPLPWIARRKCGSKSSRRLLRGARNCCQAVFVHPARLRPPEPCLCRTSKSPAGNSTQHQNRAKLILGRTPRDRHPNSRRTNSSESQSATHRFSRGTKRPTAPKRRFSARSWAAAKQDTGSRTGPDQLRRIISRRIHQTRDGIRFHLVRRIRFGVA